MSLKASDSETQTSDEEVQVLEFELDGQRYCITIEEVMEIVDEEPLTKVPASDRHVLGVMDLRDATTTIIDPTVVFGVDSTTGDRRIIIFDDDLDDQYGWLVNSVHRVSTFQRSDVEEQADAESIRGLVNRDEDFLIWVDPGMINGEATTP
jgi:purine-binding chemotaxis protein CheW